VSGGTIAINGGDATGITDVAAAFIAAFPDIEVSQDDLVFRDDGSVEYRWTFTGTSAETGKRVRECPRKCVGMNERDAHAFNDKQEISRSSEFL
jgi:hypothetical protein